MKIKKRKLTSTEKYIWFNGLGVVFFNRTSNTYEILQILSEFTDNDMQRELFIVGHDLGFAKSYHGVDKKLDNINVKELGPLNL